MPPRILIYSWIIHELTKQFIKLNPCEWGQIECDLSQNGAQQKKKAKHCGLCACFIDTSRSSVFVVIDQNRPATTESKNDVINQH